MKNEHTITVRSIKLSCMLAMALIVINLYAELLREIVRGKRNTNKSINTKEQITTDPKSLRHILRGRRRRSVKGIKATYSALESDKFLHNLRIKYLYARSLLRNMLGKQLEVILLHNLAFQLTLRLSSNLQLQYPISSIRAYIY